MMSDISDITEHIATNVSAVRDRIAAACARAGRTPEEVTLVAVSKTFTGDAVEAAVAAGITDLAENRVQEFVEKADRFPSRHAGGSVTWHMIGHLQRNKCRDVVARADLFHALDSLRLARELDRRAGEAGRVLPCLVQVNVSGEESKFGFAPSELRAFVREIAAYQHLAVRGLMTLAAPVDDPEDVRPQFRLLRSLRDDLRETVDGLDLLSMGMSGDYEVAIEEGATHVRIGSAIFGRRPQ
jgi:PLP dependent protein